MCFRRKSQLSAQWAFTVCSNIAILLVYFFLLILLSSVVRISLLGLTFSLFSDLFAAIVSEDLDELGDNSPTISSKAGQKTTILPFWQCWGYVTFLCGSGFPDPYLRLMDPDPAPDSTRLKTAAMPHLRTNQKYEKNATKTRRHVQNFFFNSRSAH